MLCTTSFVLSLLILVSIGNGNYIDCRNKTCNNRTLTCIDNEDCFIDCAFDDGCSNDPCNEPCQGAKINCPISGNCTVLCDIREACEAADIYAQNSSSLHITCNDYWQTCRHIKIYCPDNGHNGSPTCIIQSETGNNNDQIFDEMQIYAVEGLNDITMTFTDFNDINGANITVYCTPGFSKNCELDWGNPDTQCYSGDSICESYLLPTSNPTLTPSNDPTDNPTLIPSKFPTKQPSTNPTRLPSTIPTRLPSAIPTRLPSTIPTQIPSFNPTMIPSSMQTDMSTEKPTYTGNPTINPTENGQSADETTTLYLLTQLQLVKTDSSALVKPEYIIIPVVSIILCLLLCILYRKRKMKERKALADHENVSVADTENVIDVSDPHVSTTVGDNQNIKTSKTVQMGEFDNDQEELNDDELEAMYSEKITADGITKVTKGNGSANHIDDEDESDSNAMNEMYTPNKSHPTQSGY